MKYKVLHYAKPPFARVRNLADRNVATLQPTVVRGQKSQQQYELYSTLMTDLSALCRMGSGQNNIRKKVDSETKTPKIT